MAVRKRWDAARAWYRRARIRNMNRRRAFRIARRVFADPDRYAARFVAALDEAAGDRSRFPRRAGEPDLEYFERVKAHLGADQAAAKANEALRGSQ